MIPYNRRAWIRLLFARQGSLERAVISRVVGFGVLSVVLMLLDRYTDLPVSLPMGFHEIAGVVIGLILAFRTNTAYARFWEGRSLWGGIVNASRNLARVVTLHAGLDEQESREFKAWIATFACATRSHLRGNRDPCEATQFLSSEDLERLSAADHMPLFCAQELSRRITQLGDRLDPMMTSVAEHELNTLVNCLGGCEKILRTPTPLGYILLMERGVFLYLITFPAALISRLGWETPFVTVAVSYLLLMIETLGNELDNPFGMDASDIPLDTICHNIAHDLLGVGPPAAIALPKGVGPVEY